MGCFAALCTVLVGLYRRGQHWGASKEGAQHRDTRDRSWCSQTPAASPRATEGLAPSPGTVTAGSWHPTAAGSRSPSLPGQDGVPSYASFLLHLQEPGLELCPGSYWFLRFVPSEPAPPVPLSPTSKPVTNRPGHRLTPHLAPDKGVSTPNANRRAGGMRGHVDAARGSEITSPAARSPQSRWHDQLCRHWWHRGAGKDLPCGCSTARRSHQGRVSDGQLPQLGRGAADVPRQHPDEPDEPCHRKLLLQPQQPPPTIRLDLSGGASPSHPPRAGQGEGQLTPSRGRRQGGQGRPPPSVEKQNPLKT